MQLIIPKTLKDDLDGESGMLNYFWEIQKLVCVFTQKHLILHGLIF